MVIPEMITLLFFIAWATIGTKRGEFINATEDINVVSASILNILDRIIDIFKRF